MSSDELISPIECPKSWRRVTLKSICRKIGSGATPTGGQATYLTSRTNFALVRSQNVFDREFSCSGLAFISDEQATGLKNVQLEAGDILLNITGDGITFGRTCVVPSSILPACVNQHVAIIRTNRQDADPGYVVSYLTHPLIKSYIESFNAGGSRRAITKFHIESFVVPLPPRGLQIAIGNLLGSLDDRIALLRETNVTLEAIAQAMFKSWFVDFDPVRANSEGRAPVGIDEAIAALFPDNFVESALGLTPKGWPAITLAGLTEKHGGTIQTGPFGSQLHASDYSDEGTPVAMPKDIVDRRINTSTVARVSVEHVSRLSRHQLASGDIVFSRRGDVERHALVTSREAGWLCGTGCLLVRPGEKWRWPAYLSMFLDTAHAKAWLVQHAVGATMPNLNTGILGSVPLVLPPCNILDQFESVAMALEERRSENLATMQTLAGLRDTLLPRLISGQLRLPDVDAAMEDIAA
jgi:type I restriction enzyme, S subunit